MNEVELLNRWLVVPDTREIWERMGKKYFGVVASLADASPTDNEMPVYEEAEEVLNRSAEILKELEEYKGAGEEIREVSDSRGFHSHPLIIC